LKRGDVLELDVSAFITVIFRYCTEGAVLGIVLGLFANAIHG
jgi:hypothetical protein